MSDERKLRSISNPHRKTHAPTASTKQPQWHPDTPIIHALLPIAPGWIVYALFAHYPPDFEPHEPRPRGQERPPVVEHYPVAAWADVEHRWYQLDADGEPTKRSFQREWEAMITIYSGFEMETELSIADYLRVYAGFVTCAVVGPGQRLPDWVESVEARAVFIAGQQRWEAEWNREPEEPQ